MIEREKKVNRNGQWLCQEKKVHFNEKKTISFSLTFRKNNNRPSVVHTLSHQLSIDSSKKKS